MTGLPTPSLSATVHPPPNRAMGGRVEITFDAEKSARPEPPEPRPVDHVHDVTCTLCHRVGHARSNRKLHPPVGE